MNESERIRRNHEECLALLTPEQRRAVLGETTRLLERLRLATRLQQMRSTATKIQVADDVVAWLKALAPKSRIIKIERKKA